MTPQEDFDQMMIGLGITRALLESSKRYMSTRPRSALSEGLKLSESKIEGDGVFAIREYRTGEEIGEIRDQLGWTEMGLKMNHSNKPNCAPNGMQMRATEDISKDEEVTCDYREVGKAVL